MIFTKQWEDNRSSVSCLLGLINERKLDLDHSLALPSKTGVLGWKLQEKQLLIDTIINGFDIPKLYFLDFTHSHLVLQERLVPYSVIDGVNRLGIIWDFYNSRFRLAKNTVFREQPGYEIGGKTWYEVQRSVHPTIFSRFLEYKLVVVSVVTDNVTELKELFARQGQRDFPEKYMKIEEKAVL